MTQWWMRRDERGPLPCLPRCIPLSRITEQSSQNMIIPTTVGVPESFKMMARSPTTCAVRNSSFVPLMWMIFGHAGFLHRSLRHCLRGPRHHELPKLFTYISVRVDDLEGGR